MAGRPALGSGRTFLKVSGAGGPAESLHAMGRKMTGKKLLGVLAVLLLLAAGAWRWFGHSTEAEEGDGTSGNERAVAAVVKVERGPMDSALTIAGEFKAF